MGAGYVGRDDAPPLVGDGVTRARRKATAAAVRLVVDHCRSSKRVRGLLCTGCNSALGHFRDSPETLTAALRYLHEANPYLKVGKQQNRHYDASPLCPLCPSKLLDCRYWLSNKPPRLSAVRCEGSGNVGTMATVSSAARCSRWSRWSFSGSSPGARGRASTRSSGRRRRRDVLVGGLHPARSAARTAAAARPQSTAGA
ncbi:endonuclease domain-containing protein [Micromonospora purpureochromogenes]|uniref:endonuclease domain-containing protein n=1 Tax=Micromonospora purpureochromogenes TaxID=47872 RepID=UPI000B5AC064